MVNQAVMEMDVRAHPVSSENLLSKARCCLAFSARQDGSEPRELTEIEITTEALKNPDCFRPLAP